MTDLRRYIVGFLVLAATGAIALPGMAQPSPPGTPPLCDFGPSFGWRSITSSDPKVKVKVWFKDEDRVSAETILGALEKDIWRKLTVLMGREPLPDDTVPPPFCHGGDARLDFYLVDLPPGTDALTEPYSALGCNPQPVYILINRAVPSLKATVAHEFMHALQWTYKTQKCLPADYKWLMEASGEWAQDYVYPPDGQGDERRKRPYFLDHPETPLDDPDLNHSYGAYLFLFYSWHRFGEKTIPRIWEATATHDSLGAINSVIPGGFEKAWPEFVALNWNREHVQLPGGLFGDDYRKWDPPFDQDMAKAVNPLGTKVSLPSGISDQRFTLDNVGNGLKHLSSLYFRFLFEDDNVRTVGFYNGLAFRLKTEDILAPYTGHAAELGVRTFVLRPMSEGRSTSASVWAFMKINGEWKQAIDLTNYPFFLLCRDVTAARIQELVLIVSNAESKQQSAVLRPQGDSPTLWASNMGCYRWKGKFEHTSRLLGGTQVVTTNVTFEAIPGNLFTPSGNGPVTSGTHWVRDANGSFLGFPVITYHPVGGNVDWKVSGSDGDCTISGKASFQVDAISDYAWFQTANFVPEGNSHRAVLAIAGTSQKVTATVTCPHGSHPETDALGAWLEIPALDLPWGRVKPDGTIKDSKGEGDETVKWCFTALREGGQDATCTP